MALTWVALRCVALLKMPSLALAQCSVFRCRYTALLDRLDSVPMAELVMAIRRTSPGFTRGSSSFRGVTQHKSGAQPLLTLSGPSMANAVDISIGPR